MLQINGLNRNGGGGGGGIEPKYKKSSVVHGTDGIDTLDQVDGISDDDNSVFGLGGNDTIFGLGGNDFLKGGGGGDSLDGGDGIDTASYADSAAGVTINLASDVAFGGDADGDDLNSIENLMGSAYEDRLAGDDGANTLTGLDGNDTLKGFGGQDSLYGGEGADDLFGGAGIDTMDGGNGSDDYFVDEAGDVIVEWSGKGTLDRVYSSVSYTLGAGVNVEWLETNSVAGSSNINLTGNEIGNALRGNAGNNVLNGAGGADAMSGLAGDDHYFIDNSSDMVVEAVGQGTMDRVFTGVSYKLGAGVEIEKFSTTNHGGLAPIDLQGNELANAIYGNAGHNWIYGKAGNDTLTGFGGPDVFVFDTALDAANNVDTISDFDPANDLICLPVDSFIFNGTGKFAFYVGSFTTGTAAAEADDRIIFNDATGALSYDADGNGAGAAIQFAQLGAGVALTEWNFMI
jgi:Ca2+-binding RTX toxin-like protein